MVTWLASVAMVAMVVMGVAKEAVTVPRVDTPAETCANFTLMPLAHSGCAMAEEAVSARCTCCPLNNQRGDGGLDSARHQTDSSHWHCAEDSAGCPRGSLQQNLNAHVYMLGNVTLSWKLIGFFDFLLLSLVHSGV